MAMFSYNKTSTNMLLRFRYQSRAATFTNSETIRPSAHENRMNVRWQGNFTISSKATIQLRTEWVSFQHLSRSETGFLSFVGMNYRPSPRWQIKGRFSIFETNSFASAIWAFEDDLPYSFSVPAFFLTGQRWYAMACFKATQNIEIWLRVANTYLPAEQNLGSGLDMISGNQRTEVKLMLRTNF
jgi:hypothetical protein